MTKYILHGGSTREESPDNKVFFQEILANVSDKGKVLLVNFARDDWEEVKEGHIGSVTKEMDVEVIISEEDKIVEQIKEAEVIYLIGGDTFKLMDALSKVPDIEKLFEGKTVAGSSAGAYALCKYFYENDDGRLGEGLGILDIKSFCHYDESKNGLVEQLDSFKEKLPILILPNHKWAIIFK